MHLQPVSTYIYIIINKTPMRKAMFAALVLCAATLTAQDIIYEKSDSIFVTEIINKEQPTRKSGELALHVARQFLGKKYKGGTLDTYNGEPLVINCRELDCTTFVETVLALVVTIREGEKSFEEFCHNLQTIRYRNGERKGYASRLHYISWWIADSAKKGIIHEATHCTHSRPLPLNLHYMSRNAALYPQLKADSSLVALIEREEKPFRGTTTEYIPKEELHRGRGALTIADGDIIALVTNIEGLDVVHIGFALWRGEKLHLLHASSGEGKVIEDGKTLYDYQKNKKKQTGIRVFAIE